ncbi:phosphoglycerate mutase-like protein [Cylindrobasidium torrendii FP15055 ss-10]|uniref:Phosphoglycerate mutase-like protein n=1 Tax=Cylindrobasidium torrendii FP15055 ss-10 TaxID=1314674 RepID=A0A0D7B4Z9_9AGAR|nr:phosphoglycerate mutase-like protein [Cylindrobasidium torrendii FP15055 ss-10]
MSNDTVLGVVVLTRHGDRQGFYQDPKTLKASDTSITPLGNVQEYQLGSLLRSIYLNSTSESFVKGINASIVNLDQVKVRADAGGEGGVIYNSAVSLLQGLFPANSNYSTTLANGTVVEGPLDGYQYVPIETVEPDNDVSLEGWTDCATFDDHTSDFYKSDAFKQKASEASDFLSKLPQYLDGRPATLEGMWNVYDFMNVENIHDASFANAIPDGYMQQARALANWHEYGVFSDSSLNGIGNIAARAMLPSVFEAFEEISSGDMKLYYIGVSYKPFLSLFNMTQLDARYPELHGIVNYAAAVTLEVRQPSTGNEPVLRFNFKNGTDDAAFTTYNLFGKDGDIPVSEFVNTLQPAAINSTAEWCSACSNSADRGCGALSQAAASARTHQIISPVGAGFLGAGLTLAVALIMFLVLLFLGVLTVGHGKRSRKSVETKA